VTFLFWCGVVFGIIGGTCGLIAVWEANKLRKMKLYPFSAVLCGCGASCMLHLHHGIAHAEHPVTKCENSGKIWELSPLKAFEKKPKDVWWLYSLSGFKRG